MVAWRELLTHWHCSVLTTPKVVTVVASVDAAAHGCLFRGFQLDGGTPLGGSPTAAADGAFVNLKTKKYPSVPGLEAGPTPLWSTASSKAALPRGLPGGVTGSRPAKTTPPSTALSRSMGALPSPSRTANAQKKGPASSTADSGGGGASVKLASTAPAGVVSAARAPAMQRPIDRYLVTHVPVIVDPANASLPAMRVRHTSTNNGRTVGGSGVPDTLDAGDAPPGNGDASVVLGASGDGEVGAESSILAGGSSMSSMASPLAEPGRPNRRMIMSSSTSRGVVVRSASASSLHRTSGSRVSSGGMSRQPAGAAPIPAAANSSTESGGVEGPPVVLIPVPMYDSMYTTRSKTASSASVSHAASGTLQSSMSVFGVRHVPLAVFSRSPRGLQQPLSATSGDIAQVTTTTTTSRNRGCYFLAAICTRRRRGGPRPANAIILVRVFVVAELSGLRRHARRPVDSSTAKGGQDRHRNTRRRAATGRRRWRHTRHGKRRQLLAEYGRRDDSLTDRHHRENQTRSS